MAKRFKFRISRIIPSFQSCRSKQPSALPSNPALIDLHFSTITPPTSKPHQSSIRRHVSSAFMSVGCGFRSRATLSDDDQNEPHDFLWKREDKWHVVAKVYDDTTPRRKIYNSPVSGCDDDDVMPIPPSQCLTCDRKKKKKKKRWATSWKKLTPRVRISTSSADSCGLFSSDGYDDEEKTEALVLSSRSFSTDSSSEFNPHLETIRETPTHEGQKKKKKKKKKKQKKARRSDVPTVAERKNSVSSPESVSPARLSMFQRLLPWRVEGKVRESFAVMKKSEDPYEDFRTSMMEMILEKQISEVKDLEQLLHCFLSLNSRKYHGVIVEAFTEIWLTLFCKTS